MNPPLPHGFPAKTPTPKVENKMKSFRILAALGAFVLLPLVSPGQTPATPAPNHYFNIAYLKPLPGKSAEYVKVAREGWKLVHQDMVNRGRLISWRLYAVSWPNGDDQEYDYATIMEFARFADLESPYSGTDYAKVLGGAQKYSELIAKSGATRRLLRNDILAVLHATDGWSTAANQVMAVHFLHSLPGKASDLIRIQREHFLPSNNELVKAGGATGWATTAVRYPASMDHPYDYISFNAYANLAQMEKDPPQAWLDKWTGAKAAPVSAELPNVRKRVKGQLWRLIDQTTPANKSGT
jgi:hypothetical protein